MEIYWQLLGFLEKVQAKTRRLQKQIATVRGDMKERVDQHIAGVRADYNQRSDKLKQALKLTKEVLPSREVLSGAITRRTGEATLDRG